tara:strand:+ start:2279 stop:3208 length:930 start_codon:yes stop_codon:yes gene_type:complete
MKKTALYYSNIFLEHIVPNGHPENKNRIKFIIKKIKESNFKNLKFKTAKPANHDILKLGHTERYINWLSQLKPAKEIIKIDQDTFMSPKTLEAAKTGVGCLVDAIDNVLEKKYRNAFCLLRPPGHHAEREKAMGFCFFSTIGIGAKYLKKVRKLHRIAVVDFDVHHGNGTQNVLWNEPNCLFISIHQDNIFPFTGSKKETGIKDNILNIPVNASSNSNEFRNIVDKIVIPRLIKFEPDFLLISSGFDGHKDDQISQTQWEESNFIYITKKLKSVANQFCEDRIVSCLEGGYHLEKLSTCCVSHLKTLME